jgi:hypothetical protein
MKYRLPAKLAPALILLTATVAGAVEHVIVEREGQTHHVSGRLITDAQDGGLLILAQDGMLWAIQPDEITQHRRDDKPFEALDRAVLARQLLADLPDGFEVHTTAHYTVLHNTSKIYAQWYAGLVERLHRGFTNFWQRRRMPIHDPEVPLVAIVFKDKGSYATYSQRELGEAAGSIVGYYSLATNRVVTFNLTGIDARFRTRRLTSGAQIDQILSSPEGAHTVATIVHEATHQLAFNCGLHHRWGDVPMWVSEGIAVYFETPDLDSSKGWRSIGAINRGRLIQFRNYLARRPADSLATLVADDSRFRTADTALNAYAETWALNHYLLGSRSEQYVEYLQKIANRPPLAKDTPEERLQLFRSAFGADLKGLDEAFVRQTLRLR